MPLRDLGSIFTTIFSPSRDKFSVGELRRLHKVLLRFSSATASSGAQQDDARLEYIEALRAVAEIVIWYVEFYELASYVVVMLLMVIAGVTGMIL